MAITDELREWAKTLTRWWYDPVKNEYTYTSGTMPPSIDANRLDSNITAIADRIDKEHERLMEERADEYHKLRVYAEDCCVELPKDADGEYIHIGDMMENGERVARIVLTDGSWDPSVYTAKTPNQLREYFCCEISHYHAPTVEDVLHKLVGKAQALGCVEDEDALVAEYAAKLRLANNEE